MTQQKDEALVPTQADRQAAISYFASLKYACEKWNKGGAHHPLVDAFARHAAAAREEARREGWNAAIEAGALEVDNYWPGHNEPLHVVTRERIAIAIRNLKDRPNDD